MHKNIQDLLNDSDLCNKQDELKQLIFNTYTNLDKVVHIDGYRITITYMPYLRQDSIILTYLPILFDEILLDAHYTVNKYFDLVYYSDYTIEEPKYALTIAKQ